MNADHDPGWVGVDLDGTLAFYDRWRGVEHIGDPVPAMLERVKRWLAEGRDVRIFTARATAARTPDEHRLTIATIRAWCERHLGVALPVTAEKDIGMAELWDDRVVAVEPNTGRALSPSRRGLEQAEYLETLGEIAKYLGRSERWCRYMRHRRVRPLPVVRFCGRVRAHRATLDQWVADEATAQKTKAGL